MLVTTKFLKGFLFRVVKSRDCVVKSYPFPKQALVFVCMQYKSFENNEEKGEIARNKEFLLF